VKRYLLLAALLFWGYHAWWGNRSLAHAPGVLTPGEPEQKSLPDAKPLTHGDFSLRPLAHFSIRARVLGRENYYLGREADLAPLDLALGWGPMSDSAVLDRLRISQSGRFYFWSADTLPIPRDRITRNSSNMHMIPATETVADELDEIIEGDIVRFSGKLVEARSQEGWRWTSSLSRTDTGKGACELVLVEDFSIETAR